MSIGKEGLKLSGLPSLQPLYLEGKATLSLPLLNAFWGHRVNCEGQQVPQSPKPQKRKSNQSVPLGSFEAIFRI